MCGRPPPCTAHHPSHNASLANRSVLQSSCVQTFAHVIKPESCVCVCVYVYLETPPFVCIFNGSRFTVSQGCGGAGHFSQSQLVGGLLFLCTQLSRRSRRPSPAVHTLAWGGWRGFGVDCGWVGLRGGLLMSSFTLLLLLRLRLQGGDIPPISFYGSTPGTLVLCCIVWMNDELRQAYWFRSILAVNISCPLLLLVRSGIQICVNSITCSGWFSH